MTYNPAFLAAILHAPEDDAPRLVYADWLDEHGEHTQAEFIRLQIELFHTYEWTRKSLRLITSAQDRKLIAREEELWSMLAKEGYCKIRMRVTSNLHNPFYQWTASIPMVLMYEVVSREESTQCFGRLFRGFIDQIAVPMSFFDHPVCVADVFSQLPISSVRLTDRYAAWYTHNTYAWTHENATGIDFRESHPRLSDGILSLLVKTPFERCCVVSHPGDGGIEIIEALTYRSREDADLHLSQALVAHGRGFIPNANLLLNANMAEIWRAEKAEKNVDLTEAGG